MQHGGIIATAALLPRQHPARGEVPWLARFAGKVVLDIMPGALASVIGGFLFTQYHFGHAAATPPVAEAAAPASAEMLKMVRDEHAQIMDYLRSQAATQQRQDALAQAEDQRAVADARIADAKTADAKMADAKIADARMAQAGVARRLVDAAVEPKPLAPRSGPLFVVAPAPAAAPQLVVAQANTADMPPAPIGVAAPYTVAPAPRSILARTLDIKDHVVHATLHAVSAIGSIPSWIASMGDRTGDNGTKPVERQFSAAS